MPARPDVTIHSRELTVMAANLLALFGNGHPSSIVKLACESTSESVEALVTTSKHIIATAEHAGETSRRCLSTFLPTYLPTYLPFPPQS